MTELAAFRNGEFIPANQLAISVEDAGFMLGVTVAEQIRTFGGVLFQWEAHLSRLWRSLEIVGVSPGYTQQELTGFALELVSRNHALLADGDDLGLCVFVTPGLYPTYAPAGGEPTLGMHTYPLPFAGWSDKYESGQILRTTEFQQVPTACWPAELKCRSRMHYYLADRAASQLQPGARAAMVDANGFVTEASTANLIVFNESTGFASPPPEDVLPGVSMAQIRQIAEKLQVPYSHRRLSPAAVAAADEVLLCSTSPCVLPVLQFDGQVIGREQTGQRQGLGGPAPGPMFRRVLGEWSDEVGINIARQARTFAQRDSAAG